MTRTKNTQNVSVHIATAIFTMSIALFFSCFVIMISDVAFYVYTSYTSAQQKKQQLFEDVEKLRNDLVALQEENVQNKKEISALNSNLKEVKKELEVARTSLSKELEITKQELDETKESLRDLQKDLREVRLEVLSQGDEYEVAKKEEDEVQGNAYVATFGSKMSEESAPEKEDEKSANKLNIVLNGEHTVNIPLGGTYDDPGVTIWDGDIDCTDDFFILKEGIVFYDTPGYYTRYYKIFNHLTGNHIMMSRKIIVQEGTAYGKTSVTGKDYIMNLIPCEAMDYLGAQLGDVIEFTTIDGKPIPDLKDFVTHRVSLSPDNAGEYILTYQFEDSVISRKISKYIYNLQT